MKINGQVVHVPFQRTIVLPRVPEDLKIVAKAVPFMEEFESKVQEPARMKKMKKGEFVGYDDEHPKYVAKQKEYIRKRFDYMVITSLTEIEWESVDINDPDTWKNWKKECVDAGISDAECSTILGGVISVHSPSQEMVDQMRADFLATQQEEEDDSNSHQEEQTST